MKRYITTQLGPFLVLAIATLTMPAPAVAGPTSIWISRVNGQFSNPANWDGGNVPVSGPSTELFFSNVGHASYRAFNDLGVLEVGGITFETRTGTATFIGQDAGSALQFGNGSFIRTTDVGLFRFGGVAGVLNDWRLTGNLSLETQSYGTVYIAPPVSGVGSLTVASTGPTEIDGFFRLEGANTFSGGVNLNSGVLEIGNATALGTGTVNANGGILRSTASLTAANNIVANGDLRLRPIAGLTLSGIISGPGGVDVRSVGNVPIAVSLTGTNTYSGATVIDMPVAYGVPTSATVGMKAGGITLSGAAGRTINSSRYDVRNGGELRLENGAAALNRLNDTAPVHLVSGRISAIGNATVGNLTFERVGELTIDGMGILFINGGNGGVTFSTPQFTRSERATLMLTLGNANSRFEVDPPPTSLVGDIDPWIGAVSGVLITSPRDLVTYDSGAYRTLTAGEYADNLAAGATANVRLTSTVNNDDVVDINALVVGTSTLTSVGITGTGTIRPASGAVILVGNVPIENNFDFQAAEGILHVGNIATINGVIAGSSGITKSGDFSLTTVAAHTYTGVTTINAGGFRFFHPNTFDTTSGFVNRTAGGGELVPSLEYRGAGTAVINKPAETRSGAFRLAATTAGNNALEYAGVISGPGAVYLESTTTNTGRLILSNDNTYAGGTRIFDAEVELNRDSNLGDPSGVLELVGTAGAGIVLTGDWNTSRPIRVLRLTTINSNGYDMSWSGRLDSRANLTKLGEGTWRITPDGVGNGGAAGWSIGSATTSSATTGGRVEIDGHVRMNWSVWDGTLALKGTMRILSTFGLGGGQPILAPGDIGGPGVGIAESWSASIALGTRIIFDLGAASDLIRLVTTFSRGSSGSGPVMFDFRIGPGIAKTDYTLVEYTEDPSPASTFVVSDFGFTADSPEFNGVFDLIVRPDGVRALIFTVTSIPCACRGDLNLDGLRDGRDIQPFVECVLLGGNCGCADVDGNGDIEPLDVTLFTDALLDATACP